LVLARIHELNEQRYKEELLAGSSQLSAKKGAKPKSKSGNKEKKTDFKQPPISFDLAREP
jgi:hypothetical protein